MEHSIDEIREPGLASDAETMFRAAVEAAEPSRLVVRAFQALPSALKSALAVRQGRLVAVGAGKAARAMAAALEDALPEPTPQKGVAPPPGLEGLIVAKRGAPGPRLRKLKLREASHPIPDADGVAAADEMLALLQSLGPRDFAFGLFSGGGSALLAAPVEGVTLEDLRATTELLYRSGASIVDVNAVRKHLSRTAGGRLAQACGAAAFVSLVISDVPGDRLDAIASGPTVADETTFRDAFACLKQRGLLESVPRAVRDHIEAGARGKLPETPKPGDKSLARARTVMIGNNRTALEAAAGIATERGFAPLILPGGLNGDARKVGEGLAKRVLQLKPKGRRAIITGGESTLEVKGGGRGGRCQELCLAAAFALAGTPGVCILAGGTDGEDGPTDAAGAIVDGATIALARQKDLDPERAQRENDTYPFFDRLGALVRTGRTGTNVTDVAIALIL